MTNARPRRQAPQDDLVVAIIQARGALLPYRPAWHQTLVRWYYFRDPPAGAERVPSSFDALAQLAAWRGEQAAHERATGAGSSERDT